MTIGFDRFQGLLSGNISMKRRWIGQALRLLEIHRAQFPGPVGRAIAFGFVPGRIEVFGRHTDFAGGRSLVCAIDRGFWFLASANRDRMIRMHEKAAEFPPAVFPFSADLAPRRGHRANYPMTMARRLARNFSGSAELKGVDIAFSSTMPVGSGMSGSSALMMMTFAAIASLNKLQATEPFRKNLHDPLDLAVYCACAENGQGFRGLRGDGGSAHSAAPRTMPQS